MNNEVKKALKAPRSSLAVMLAGLLMSENMAGFVDMAKVKERIADMDIEGSDLQIAKLEEEVLEEVYGTYNLLYVDGNALEMKPLIQVTYLFNEETEELEASTIEAGQFAISAIADENAGKFHGMSVLRRGVENVKIDDYRQLQNLDGINEGLAKAIAKRFEKSVRKEEPEAMCACITLSAQSIGCIADIVDGLPVEVKIENFKWDNEDGEDYEEGESVCDIKIKPAGDVTDTDMRDSDLMQLIRLMRKQFANIRIENW